jgi:inhibitor of KinA sporulation pathway (predicted exonuclease)
MTVFPQTTTVRQAVVFDLEFTAWEGSLAERWLAPGQFTEVVQIGGLKVEASSLEVVDAIDILVRPRLNPILSEYFVTLTGISNDAIGARGIDFADALESFLGFANGAVCAAFGTDDQVLKRNARLYGLTPAGSFPRYLNLRPWFDQNGVVTKHLHSCDVGPLLGAPFEGRQHNALDDSKSLLAGIRALIGRGAPNPFLA